MGLIIFALAEQFLPAPSEFLRTLDLEFCFLIFEIIGFTFQKIDVKYLFTVKCNPHASFA